MDAEADCRFCFFFEKADVDGKGSREGARFARHWYEKDTLLPVVPGRLPKIDVDKLNSYPDSYNSLAALSSNSFHLGVYCRDDNWQNGVPDADRDWALQLKNRMGEYMISKREDPGDEGVEDEDGQRGRLAAFATPSNDLQRDFLNGMFDRLGRVDRTTAGQEGWRSRRA
ncbi:uncharacterized protein BDW70DRAFT_164973 [Aspergillus foveolatus]|uniref:uncharacterized protein n=1 Tax=Aspergillus foveolatus TaxID=210207 RepID=UPI003CCD3F03